MEEISINIANSNIEEVVKHILSQNKITTSLLQRTLCIGWNRASNILETAVEMKICKKCDSEVYVTNNESFCKYIYDIAVLQQNCIKERMKKINTNSKTTCEKSETENSFDSKIASNEEIANYLASQRKIGPSILQRCLKIGWNKGCKILEDLINLNICTPSGIQVIIENKKQFKEYIIEFLKNIKQGV